MNRLVKEIKGAYNTIILTTAIAFAVLVLTLPISLIPATMNILDNCHDDHVYVMWPSHVAHCMHTYGGVYGTPLVIIYIITITAALISFVAFCIGMPASIIFTLIGIVHKVYHYAVGPSSLKLD
jgi:hypothetical protein